MLRRVRTWGALLVLAAACAPAEPDRVGTDGGSAFDDAGTDSPDGGLIEADGGLIEADGGQLEADGGQLEADGGQVEEDGGLIETDGGLIEADGGQAEEDGGPDGGMVEDGGAPEEPDAGLRDDAGLEVLTDAGVEPPDGGVAGDGGRPEEADGGFCPPVDAGFFCRQPVFSSGCRTLQQVGTPVTELRVVGPPPTTTGGWYPAGRFTLTSSTLYTNEACPSSGPTGISYSATLDVATDTAHPSVDHFVITQSQEGCDDVSYAFSGDTFGYANDRPWDHLSFVRWACPTCPDCGTKLKYSGTNTTFTIHLPLEGGGTLVQEFTLR